MSTRLPLFPLGTVLFPGGLIPLHVFEERYRRMVRDLLAGPDDQRRFGVLAIRQGREVGSAGVQALHPVGCVARLRRVEPYDDGRFDIVGTGVQRFRLVAVDESLPYLQGEVELLEDPLGDPAEDLVLAVLSLLARYRASLGAGPDTDDRVADPTVLSFAVGADTVLDLAEKQRLLEMPTVADRLGLAARLLRRETALLGLLPSLPGVELTRVPASPN